MIITLNIGIKNDREIAKLSGELWKRYPTMDGWGYSFITGELTIELDKQIEDELLQKVETNLEAVKDEGKLVRVEVLGKEVEREKLSATETTISKDA